MNEHLSENKKGDNKIYKMVSYHASLYGWNIERLSTILGIGYKSLRGKLKEPKRFTGEEVVKLNQVLHLTTDEFEWLKQAMFNA